MVKLIPVKYGIFDYPNGIQSNIQEVAGHFGKEKIYPKGAFSLHTEYSFDSKHSGGTLLQDFPTLRNCMDRRIPLLWYSNEWAEEFVAFIQQLCGNHIPKIIEIHPPYRDYMSLQEFIPIYTLFERRIRQVFPKVQILIENRSGTHYKSHKKWKTASGTEYDFALSTIDSLIEFSKILDTENLNLKIAFDIPQLMTAHQIGNSKADEMVFMLNRIRSIRHNIYGIHLWGKNDVIVDKNGKKVKQRESHLGNLNTYFRGNQKTKALFLETLYSLLNDSFPRYFVPEVNSNEADLASIIRDLLKSNFTFV